MRKAPLLLPWPSAFAGVVSVYTRWNPPAWPSLFSRIFCIFCRCTKAAMSGCCPPRWAGRWAQRSALCAERAWAFSPWQRRLSCAVFCPCLQGQRKIGYTVKPICFRRDCLWTGLPFFAKAERYSPLFVLAAYYSFLYRLTGKTPCRPLCPVSESVWSTASCCFPFCWRHAPSVCCCIRLCCGFGRPKLCAAAGPGADDRLYYYLHRIFGVHSLWVDIASCFAWVLVMFAFPAA